MNVLRLKSACTLPLLLLAACATTKIEPPDLPELLGAPKVALSDPPVMPSRAPRPPAAPRYSLPKATDVKWESVWQEDFVNDSAPQLLPKELLASAALVIPAATSEPARLGMVSGLLSVGVAAADMGKDIDAQLSMQDGDDKITYSLQLLDPVGRWVHSEAFNTPAVNTAFVVRVHDYEPVSRSVVKFDIEPYLEELATYNEEVVSFLSKREAYVTERAKYDGDYAEYLQAMQAWRRDMKARIEKARSGYEADCKQAEADFRALWEDYRKKAEAARLAVAEWPGLEQEPFEAPALAEPRAPEPDAIPDALLPLSLDEMRSLLLNTATEAVPATRVTLGGQFVEVGSGMTIATIDAELVLPTGKGKTRATMIRELMKRLAR